MRIKRHIRINPPKILIDPYFYNMPNIKSAKKALRQNIKRRKRNIERKKKMKAEIKNIKKLIETSKLKDAQKALPNTYKVLDKMAKIGIIKKNKASRIKSRLAKKLNAK